MSTRRIQARQTFTGTGMKNTPDEIAELEDRRTAHARATRGKGEKSFSDFLEEKMKDDEEPSPDEEETPEKGAKDPHMGLAPGQSASLVQSGKGRRAGKVIVKG